MSFDHYGKMQDQSQAALAKMKRESGSDWTLINKARSMVDSNHTNALYRDYVAYTQYWQAAKDALVKEGAGRYQDGQYVGTTAADKSHAASAEKNAGKAYRDIAPSTGSLLSQYSGDTPSEAEAYKMARRDGAGMADAAANGKAGRRKKTLLGGYYGESMLGG